MSFESITLAKLQAEKLPGVRASILKAFGCDNLQLSVQLRGGGRLSRRIPANQHGAVKRTAVAEALAALAGVHVAHRYLYGGQPWQPRT